MSKVLVIVESPAKAKTIGKFLGKRYTVKASMGHVRDLPRSQFGVDIEHNFNPKYITIRGKGDLLKELRTAAKKADKILLAPDPDREGEAIAWHLQHILGLAEKDKCRIEFNEITKDAVQNALQSPRTIDYTRVNAQQARRILDRLVGYNLSPLLWRKVKKGLSAGRVQSVAVRLISDREEEIKAFVPEEYWTLQGLFNKEGEKKALEAKLALYKNKKVAIASEEAVKNILSDLKDASYTITGIKKKEKKRHPAPPFITSSLQQEAYRKLNFPARKTMQVAQQLYEGLDIGPEGTVGLVSYIRTDSTRVAETAQQEAKEFITETYGPTYHPGEFKQYTNRNKAQNAHEAIRPTSMHRGPERMKQFLSRDQYRLYKLIYDRFVSSQMSPAVMDTTSIDIKAGDFVFRATGSIIKFPGFMKLYIEDRDDGEKDEEKVLPELAEGDTLTARELNPKQHFTQPPPRYTDASLVKALEENGIGRPSTYAPTVETIQRRGYVVREEKQFYPTELGMIVVEMLKEFFPAIIDIQFTADLEDKLDMVEEGEMEWVKVLKDFYDPFSETLENAEEKIGVVEIEDEVSDEVCEQCGRNLVIKMGRYGKFLACPGFPDCRFTKPLLEDTGVKCPKCEGALVARRSKKGRKFYGCSNYPECDFVTWDLPTEKKCPHCNSMMVQKNSAQKGVTLQCTGTDCKYREQGGQEQIQV